MKKASKITAGILILTFVLSIISFVPNKASALNVITPVDTTLDTQAIDSIVDAAKLDSGDSEDDLAYVIDIFRGVYGATSAYCHYKDEQSIFISYDACMKSIWAK
jgi:hypothetical protein